jgi:enoyl-CoA hydratase
VTSPVVRFERCDRVALVTLDRPERLNAIGALTLEQLDRALTDIGEDPALGVVVITGAGKAFCAGADIAELATLDGPRAFAEHLRHFTDVFGRLQELPKPSIAAIDGIALGGGFELALACDLRIGSRRARLGVPEVKLGLLPGAGGSQRLARMLPPGLAKQLLMTGEPLDGAAAHRLGLLNELVDDGEALPAALRLAATMSALPPLALAAAKALVDEGGPLPLGAGIARERDAVAMLSTTADAAEGINAFLAKRAPCFHGR